jgi:hypothetical protein
MTTFPRAVLAAVLRAAFAAGLMLAGPLALAAGSATDAPTVAFEALRRLDDGRSEGLGTDGARGDAFGAAIAIDGDRAVVGVPGDSLGADWIQGSAYVFVRQPGGWVIEAKLVASDAGYRDFFGLAVAISGDTVLVGSPYQTVEEMPFRGSAYVYTRDGGAWTQQAKLIASDGATQHTFGRAVALAGDTALVTAPVAGGGVGAAYLYTRVGATWTESVQLAPPAGLGSAARGHSAAMDADTLAIGGESFQSGVVDVYERTGAAWTFAARLVGTDPAVEDFYGIALAVDADTIVVGAPWFPTGGIERLGAAFVYRRGSAGWTQEARLDAPDPEVGLLLARSVAVRGDRILLGASSGPLFAPQGEAAAAPAGAASSSRAYAYVRNGGSWSAGQRIDTPGVTNADRYGKAVAIGIDDALVGAPGRVVAGNEGQGAAYALVRDGEAWLNHSRLEIGPGREGEMQGDAVAIDGDTILVGMPGADVKRGMAQVYVRAGQVWVPQARLQAPDGAAYDEFGGAVAIDGDTALVGARVHATNGDFARGAAYVYVRSGSAWSLQAKLAASNGGAGALFGHAVALDDASAIVSSYLGRAAHVYVRDGNAWIEQAGLQPADPWSDDHAGYGYAVALDGNTALVSSNEETVGGVAFQGAVYAYTRSGAIWREHTRLLASDGGEGHGFGRAIAIDGGRIAIAAGGANSGRGGVYMLELEGGAWQERGLLGDFGPGSPTGLGTSVALAGSTLVVGGPSFQPFPIDTGGAAYVFHRNAQGWTLAQRLANLDDGPDAYFASVAAISGDTLVLGAPGTNGTAPYGNPRSGAAYVVTAGLFDDGFE